MSYTTTIWQRDSLHRGFVTFFQCCDFTLKNSGMSWIVPPEQLFPPCYLTNTSPVFFSVFILTALIPPFSLSLSVCFPFLCGLCRESSLVSVFDTRLPVWLPGTAGDRRGTKLSIGLPDSITHLGHKENSDRLHSQAQWPAPNTLKWRYFSWTLFCSYSAFYGQFFGCILIKLNDRVFELLLIDYNTWWRDNSSKKFNSVIICTLMSFQIQKNIYHRYTKILSSTYVFNINDNNNKYFWEPNQLYRKIVEWILELL